MSMEKKDEFTQHLVDTLEQGAKQYSEADHLIRQVLYQYRQTQTKQESLEVWQGFEITRSGMLAAIRMRYHYLIIALLAALVFLPTSISTSLHMNNPPQAFASLGELTPQKVNDLEMLSVLGEDNAVSSQP